MITYLIKLGFDNDKNKFKFTNVGWNDYVNGLWQ